MKTSPDHPDFTAWLMGELPHEQATALEREIASDPAMQLVATEQQEFLQQLTQWMGGSQESLDARRREKILRAARQRDETPVVALSARPRNRSWGWISLATAALAIIGAWIGWQFPLQGGKGNIAFDDVTREIALLPSDAQGFPSESSATPDSTTAVGGSSLQQQRDEMWTRKPDQYMQQVAKRLASGPIPTPSELPATQDRGFVSASEHPVAPLPLRVGTASWSWVKRSIVEQGRLPHPSLVRPEEMINAFEFSSGEYVFCQGLTIKALALPRDGGFQKILLSLRNGSQKAIATEWSYHGPQKCRYRLIGFGVSSSASHPATVIGANSSVTVMLELDLASDQSDLGQVSCRVAGVEKSLMVLPGVKATADASFFSLLTNYISWLRNPNERHSPLHEQANALESQNLSEDQRLALSIMKKSFAFSTK